MIPLIGEQRNINSPCHETSFLQVTTTKHRPSFIQVTTRNRLKRAISRYNIDEFKSILGFRQVTIHPKNHKKLHNYLNVSKLNR